jgi:hypothetical protein
MIWTNEMLDDLPRRTPTLIAPFTRRMPAASSGLRRPVSAASYASRRTAASRRFIVDADNRRDSNSSRYRSTTILLKARRGSDQYHATKSSIGNRYDRFDSDDRRVFRTALLAKSRPGRRSTRFGACLAFLRLIDKRSPYPLVRSTRIPSSRRERRLTGRRYTIPTCGLLLSFVWRP